MIQGNTCHNRATIHYINDAIVKTTGLNEGNPGPATATGKWK
jgi:hypothetical protein